MISLQILIGTRPNFIKVTQFKKLALKYGINISLIHTGQHSASEMSDVFFNEFELRPDVFLNIKPSSASGQIAQILLELEKYYIHNPKPDLLMVPGDVTSTLAGALFANKNNIPLAHLEAGLRSFDRSMPEEHNRFLTDAIADYLFVTEQSGIDNLKNEKNVGKIFFVGNTMIDTLIHFEDKIDRSKILKTYRIQKPYCLVTIHRPSNVDTKSSLTDVVHLLREIASDITVVFPVHPRTKNHLIKFELIQSLKNHPGIILTDPLGYFDFQKLIKESTLVLTDSGGVQEETTFRQIPCLTLRPNTERPVTCVMGTNTLVPFDIPIILDYIRQIKKGQYKKGQVPPLWDGMATQRILEIITDSFK
jgi:UDP-N-acetylglucosamine 2-epimerase (non-hydrolysing)